MLINGKDRRKHALRRFLFVAALAALVSFAGPTLADTDLADANKAGDIHIKNPWARATPPGAPNGAAYMALMNKGKTPDRLIKVTSPVAKKAEMHTHLMAGDIMRMRRVKFIDVMPGKALTFRPGGHHIMLFGLKQTLKAGMTFPLTLTFKHAGKIKINIMVQKMGAMGPMKSDSSSSMNHGHKPGHK